MVTATTQKSESAQRVFLLGMRDMLPVLIGVLPFGMILGVVSADVGLTTVQTIGRSLFVFAGVSELAMLDLLAKDAAAWVIILSAFVINLRQFIFSASISQHYQPRSIAWKLLLSYTLVDQVYAFSIHYFDEHPNSQFKHWYHFGTAVPIMVVWFTAVVVGFKVGAIFPESWSINFVVPLMFLSLIPPSIKGFSYIAAALVSTAVALAAFGLPNNLGLILATFSGILIGYILDGKVQN